jgi:hypothetical protein
MRARSADEVAWDGVSGHRSGRIEFKRLLAGRPGTPDNYELSLVRSGADYFTPRHRHNFDQLRIGVSGALNYTPGRDVDPGSAVYFPEGTFYGPQRCAVDAEVLLLQCGGASGDGFMSYEELGRGHAELARVGRFEDGVFRREPGQVGRRTQDGYEAIWEHVNRRELRYPPPRWDEPVHMRVGGFAWLPVAAGVACRALASFGERGTSLAMYRVERGARLELAAEPRLRLLYVATGALAGAGTSTALEIAAGERAALEATQDAELYELGLPRFS